MKKAVVTLLGMISHKKPRYISEDGEVKLIFEDIPKKDRAIYQFSENLNKFTPRLNHQNYINTLSLLIDVFEDRKIIPIATQKAKKVQEGTLKFLKIEDKTLDNTIVIDESNYEETFQKISELLQHKEYESFIVDLTHGFRHLPILMMVNLIISSIKDLNRVEHIFFAKEIVPFKQYEIIDLLEYIGLAKLSFVLENFNNNYTVGNKLAFRNPLYQELVDSLRIISGHILANSIKRLLEGEKSLIGQTIETLKKLQKDDKKVATFNLYIEKIIDHLEEIESLKKEKDYIRLFKLSQIMKKREYLLNAITLLNESVGLYCAEKIRKISPRVSLHINSYMNERDATIYQLSHHSKNIIKLEERFRGDYLTRGVTSHEIVSVLKQQNNLKLKTLIKQIENLRNNLAHGNSSDKIPNVKFQIGQLTKEFQQVDKEEDELL